jgi:hypothetical protein
MGFYPATANQAVAGNLVVSGSISGGAISGSSISGGTLAGTTVAASGIISANAGTKTSGSAPAIAPANGNGVAAQLSDLTRDYMVYLTIGTAGTLLTVLIGPTATPANTIYNAATATAGEVIGFRLPAGWFWEWAATTATLALQEAIGC